MVKEHEAAEYGIRSEAKEYPMMIVLSFVYVCNARCPNCPYNNSDIRSQYKDTVFMDPDLLKRIADESGVYGTVLRFSGGGEPMLHPYAAGCIAYARTRGCLPSIITNGSRPMDDIVNFADMIEFSVDAGNKKDYALTRPGLNWDVLNKNVQDVLRKRRKTKIIASVINQQGIDVDGAVKYWSNLVDHVQVRKYLTWGYNIDKSADPTPYLDNESVPCPWLFERLNIDSRGHVTYCGEDIAFANKFASIDDRSIKDIWLGHEFEAIRTKHLAGRGGDIGFCAKCPDRKFRSWNYNYWQLRDRARNHITA